MGSLMNALGPILLLGAGAILIMKRCEWLDFCGDGGAAGEEVPSTDIDVVTPSGETVTTNFDDEDGNGLTDFDEKQGAGAFGANTTYKCCECKMVGDRVKCQKNGSGSWFNPPAVNGESNDQSLSLSVNACAATCGGSLSASGSGSAKAGSSAKGSSRPTKVSSPPRKSAVSSGAKQVAPKPKANAVSKGAGATTPKSNAVTRGATRRTSWYTNRSYFTEDAAFYTNRLTARSYFSQPGDTREYQLYHRLAN